MHYKTARPLSSCGTKLGRVSEIIAMRVSTTPTTPLRPSYTSYFSLYRFPARSSSIAYSSSGSFRASSKALYGCKAGTSSDVAMFNGPFCCRKSSFCTASSLVRTHKCDDSESIIKSKIAWSNQTEQMKRSRSKESRLLEIEFRAKNVQEKVEATQDFLSYMESHCTEDPSFSKVQANSDRLSNGHADYSNIIPPIGKSPYGSNNITGFTSNRQALDAIASETHSGDTIPSKIEIKGSMNFELGRSGGHMKRLESSAIPSLRKDAEANGSLSLNIIADSERKHFKSVEAASAIKRGIARDLSLEAADYRTDTKTIKKEDGDNSKQNVTMKNVNGQPKYGSKKLKSSAEPSFRKDAKLNGSVIRNIVEGGKKKNFKPVEAASVIEKGIGCGVSLEETDCSSYAKIIGKADGDKKTDIRKRLSSIYGKVLVVDTVPAAKEVTKMLENQYRHLVYACDTEVSKIDVKQETPVGHGKIICFSIYCGPEADFGDRKSCIWVDVLDGGGKEILHQFKNFFEDPSIKKVWHNYSFDCHILENYGIKVSGFHADTMHMARLWDSSRRAFGGYSLEALTGDSKVMSGARLHDEKDLIGKVSMKTIFGKKKLKKDGSEGKIVVIAPVEELQKEERILWVCYSSLDAICTLKLYESLKKQLSIKAWEINGRKVPGSMFKFYEEYWRPFGELLVKMETEGMLVDRAYLAEMENLAKAEQAIAANRFRMWASKYCPDAKYMNVGSDAQLRQLLFGGTLNSKNQNESLPTEKTFKIPNVDKVIEEGKKTPTKYRNITLHCIGDPLPAETYTESGWPSVSGDALKVLAGKVSVEFDFMDDACELQSEDEAENACEITTSKDVDKSVYGTAFKAFQSEEDGKEACRAIAALCENCSIDSLISNFILPLQGSNISGKNGRVHCSLNINTETGRLSARRPNLQNQPALEKDRYKIRQAFIAAPGNSLIVADYGQLELRILAHLADCKSMLDAFKAGGDFHSRTAMNMYQHIRKAVEEKQVLLEWDPQPGEDNPPAPLLKDKFASERRKAKMLNFSIAYGKTPVGLARDWKVSVEEAKQTVELWYKERREVRTWQEARKKEACGKGCVRTLLGRSRQFPSVANATRSQRGHIERAAINTPVQGSAADVAMLAMLQISKNSRLKELGWRLLLQVHDEVILEGPIESAENAKAIVVECMSKPFEDGKNILKVDLAVDAKCAQNWYSAK